MNNTWKDLQKSVFFSWTLLFPSSQRARSRTLVSGSPPSQQLPCCLPLQPCLAHCLYLFLGSGSFTFLCWAGSNNITTVIAKEVFLLYFFPNRACFSCGQDLPVQLWEYHWAWAPWEKPGHGRAEAGQQGGDQPCVSQWPPCAGKSPWP